MFRALVLDPTAHGVMLTDRAKYVTSVMVFGILGILAGVVFFVSGRSDREMSPYFFAGGGAVASVGFVARWAIRRGDRRRAGEPRTLKGLVVTDAGLAWGTCRARFGHTSEDGSSGITSFRVGDHSPVDARPATLRILVAPREGHRHHEILRFGLYDGDRLVGEVTREESSAFFLLAGSPAVRSRPLPLATDAEDNDMSRTCVRNLRQIGALLSGHPDLQVRLAMAYPKEGVMKWGLVLGMVGGLIAAGIEERSKGKLQSLLDEGGLRDSEGSLLNLAEHLGWQMELV